MIHQSWDIHMPITALIPAYNPTSELKELVGDLLKNGFERVVVVDDGSEVASKLLFDSLKDKDRVVLLRHAVNLGKGAALKTGLNYIYCHSGADSGVVTLDADGQHLVEDALKVAVALIKHPESLIMGTRVFDKDVPLRSRIGNVITRHLFRLLTGINLTDTQTGLRGIPKDYIPPLLKIKSNGYEFELDMLIACKYTGVVIVEQTINTVYIDGNRSSYFNPIIDSMKIYFVLFGRLFMKK
jgi:glycosyltransferase involved in cell wall biosynthesis